MEGFTEYVKIGARTDQDLLVHFPLTRELLLKLNYPITIDIHGHSLSGKKGHGLYRIAYDNNETYHKVDLGFYEVLNKYFDLIKNSSQTTFYEVLFNDKRLSLSYAAEKGTDNSILLRIINAMHIKPGTFVNRCKLESRIDSTGKLFQIIVSENN